MRWMIAAEDLEAPPAATLARLAALRDVDHRPVSVRVFEGADHGMLLFRETGGAREYRGVHPDFVQEQVRWLRERFGMAAP
jgi:hypothetical protein